MFNDFSGYYERKIAGDYRAYIKICTNGTSCEDHDVRAALVSAESLFHLREHLPTPLSRAEVEKMCPDYGVLGDIVNASKHKSVQSKTPHGLPLVSSATQISEMLHHVVYSDEQGKYYHIHKVVNVVLDNGTHLRLSDLLTTVINFWEQYLYAQGIINWCRPYKNEDEIRYRKREDCINDNFVVTITRGLGFRLSAQFFIFDAATNEAIKIDLADTSNDISN